MKNVDVAKLMISYAPYKTNADKKNIIVRQAWGIKWNYDNGIPGARTPVIRKMSIMVADFL